MDMQFFGLLMYAISLATMFGIYGVLCLGLNLQWGFAGLFNAGIAGFFAVGAYTTAILTSPESPNYLGGFGWPPLLALPIAMLLSGLIAWPVGRICLGLKGDYLAMATIGISEIIRLILKNEDWLANDEGLENGGRLLSAYRTSLGERIWVITEWDRSVTTLLLPDEY